MGRSAPSECARIAEEFRDPARIVEQNDRQPWVQAMPQADRCSRGREQHPGMHRLDAGPATAAACSMGGKPGCIGQHTVQRAKRQRPRYDGPGWFCPRKTGRAGILGDRLRRYAGTHYIVPPRQRGGHVATPDGSATPREVKSTDLLRRCTRLAIRTASMPSPRAGTSDYPPGACVVAVSRPLDAAP